MADWFDANDESGALAQFAGGNGNTGIVGDFGPGGNIVPQLSANEWHNGGAREQFRDAFQATGTDVNAQNALLQQYGLQADPAGRVRLPDGEVMDLRIGAKSGLNQAAWTPVSGGYQGGTAHDRAAGLGFAQFGGGMPDVGQLGTGVPSQNPFVAPTANSALTPFGFSQAQYLKDRPDVVPWVQGGGGSAYDHFLKYGQYETPEAGKMAGLDVPTPDRVNYTPFNTATPGFQAQSWNPYQQAAPYQAQAIQQPGEVSAQTIQRPDAVNAPAIQNPAAVTPQTIQRPDAVQAQAIQGPAALQALQNQAPEAFRAPTAEELAQDPSYQFRFQQGQEALQNVLAHSGALRTGNAAKALQDYGQQAASQEYGNIFNRKLQAAQTNQANALNTTQANQANLAQAYGLTNQYQQAAQAQNAANALNAGQFNVSATQQAQAQNAANALNAGQFNVSAQQAAQAQNAANALNAGQFNVSAAQQAQAQNAANALNAGQFNASTNLQTQLANQANAANAYGLNAQTGLAANQANNQGQFNAITANNALGQQGWQNQFAANQANNQGQAAATQANNAAALAAQGQQYGQAANTYGMNVGNAFNQNQANFSNALAGWQANAQNALGLGQLGLGYQQAANQYALGQGNLALGQGQLGLSASNQAFNQGLAQDQWRYQQQVTDPWNQQFALAQLGNPGAPNTYGYGNAQSDLYQGIGNANAAGQVGSANAWTNALGNVTNLANSAILGRNNQALRPGDPGYGVVMY